MGAIDKSVAETAAPSVRIELSDVGGTVPPPVASGSPGAGNGRVGLIALAVSLGLFAVLMLMIRPKDGETAAGTPITVPTATVPTESGPPESRPDVLDRIPVKDATEDPATDRLRNGSDYETANNDMFIFSLVEADSGWLALGFGQEGANGGLWRSTDGLTWDSLESDTLPSGDVLGFDRIDKTYVLAVDELRTWSSDTAFDFGDGNFPEHRITVWISLDAVNWVPSEWPATAGVGFPYPVSFSRRSYAVPMIDAAPGDNALLAALLEPFVAADLAQDVCSVERRFQDPSNSVVLSDCEGQPIIEVFEQDHPGTFGHLWREFCLGIARSSGLQRYSTVYSEGLNTGPDIEPTRIEFDDQLALFGKALDEGFQSRSADLGNESLPTECGGVATPFNAGVDDRLLYWTSLGGLVDVSPARGVIGASGPEGAAVIGSDGRYYVAMGGSVWAGTPPFEDWEQILAPPEDENAPFAGRTARVSLAFDGSLAMASAPGKLWFAEPKGEWFDVPFVQSSPDPQILLATDEFAIIQPDGFGSQRLVKVDFPG